MRCIGELLKSLKMSLTNMNCTIAEMFIFYINKYNFPYHHDWFGMAWYGMVWYGIILFDI